ncbi:MAG: N-acetylglucosamine-6-phosphate deacetylase [Agriterribacter sp.]
MSSKKNIYNGQIITPQGILQGGSVWIEENAIIAVHHSYNAFAGAEEIDAKGLYVSPGFIDIHVHGGGGYDFMDNDEKGFLEIAKLHARYGTTAMTPTTLTSTTDNMLQTLAVYEDANKKNVAGAQFLGIHLEGPYFAMSQRGAQDPRHIRNPDPEEYKHILSQSTSIKRWSAAPELKGAIEFGKYMQCKGILPAIAHTDAIYEEALEAFNNGYTLATHFYSAMSGVTRRNAYRYAGVVEAGYLIDAMDVEIIADGVHLPAPLLKLVCKIKGVDRTALITDAIRAAGMPEGESILGNIKDGIPVIVEDGVAKLPDRSSFAGSVATADRLVRTMINMAEVSLIDAIRMITATPARIMGVLEKKGTIEVNKDADIVLFDDAIHVSMTIVRGNIVYNESL